MQLAATDVSQLLRGSGLLDEVDDNHLVDLAALLKLEEFEAGETIVAEGEPADRWYVIAEGAASVTHIDLIGQAVTLAELGPGDAFGERALLGDGQVRSANVVALTRLEAYALDSAALDSPNFPKDALLRRVEILTIDTALKRASPFASLPHAALRQLANELETRYVQPGEVIIRQGDMGDEMYLIRRGSVEVVRDRRRIAVLREGDAVGEIALLTSAPRTATVRALEETELLALARDAYHRVAVEHTSVGAHFRELISARFRGAAGQLLLLPDPLTTIMPLVGLRRRKRYWMVLACGTLLFWLLTVAAQLGGGPLSRYAVAVVGSLIGPIVFVQYLAESNILTERPIELLVAAVLGAMLGLPPATWLERESGILPNSFLSAISIASIEEPAKLLGVVWLLGIPALRFRMDGVIFGAAAGMGFAAIETLLYALARVETLEPLVGMLWFRALLSPFTHGTWTAIVSATIWHERGTAWRNAAPRVAAALAIAIALHSLWDWSGLPLPFNFLWIATVGIASVATLRAILHRASMEEAHSVAALAPEAARASPAGARLRCGGCGRRAPAGSHYCPRCGIALRR